MSLPWSDEEIEYLKEAAGFIKVSTIAENLGRSYQSVTIKMKRLNIYNTKAQTGMLNIHELATILGVDRKTVEGWGLRHGLKCQKRITKEERSFFLISPEDFWEWAESHKEKVQFKNIEPHTLVPEPLWVDKERRKEIDQSLNKHRKYQVWTTNADKKLLKLRDEEGLTYKKIGAIMNRTAISVERRYNRIKNQNGSIYYSSFNKD